MFVCGSWREREGRGWFGGREMEAGDCERVVYYLPWPSSLFPAVIVLLR